MDVETYGELYKDKDARVLCCGAYGNGINKVFNFDKEQDRAECAELLADKSVDKIFHNSLYDTSWLYCLYDFNIKGIIHVSVIIYVEKIKLRLLKTGLISGSLT